MGSGKIWMVVGLGVLITAKFRHCIQIELKKMDGGEGAAISERNTWEQKHSCKLIALPGAGEIRCRGR